METKIKFSKTQKETGREYKFSKIHQTTKVKFYDYNPYTDIKNLLLEVNIKDIENNGYSFNYAEYLIDTDNNYSDGVNVKELGEITIFLPTTKHYTNIGKEDGIYRFYNSSQNGKKLYLDTYEINDLSLIIGNGGNANVHIDEKFTASKHVTVVKIKKDVNYILIKYIYYYLYHNLQIFENKINGVGCGWMNKEQMRKVKIPVPNLEIQQQIIGFYENSKKEIEKLENEINLKKKAEKQYISSLIQLPKQDIQDEIVSVEEEVIIEPKPKTKIIIKKKVKKPIVIVEEDNEV